MECRTVATLPPAGRPCRQGGAPNVRPRVCSVRPHVARFLDTETTSRQASRWRARRRRTRIRRSSHDGAVRVVSVYRNAPPGRGSKGGPCFCTRKHAASDLSIEGRSRAGRVRFRRTSRGCVVLRGCGPRERVPLLAHAGATRFPSTGTPLKRGRTGATPVYVYENRAHHDQTALPRRAYESGRRRGVSVY